MNIKELNLIGFGKFNNKIIELEEGINIIYGENEAGKSTIHNFINGMFYGFLRPYVKRTLYLEDHTKYNPWEGQNYSGIIRFVDDNKDYRIERTFTKGNEGTIVLLEDTGEDITRDIDNGNRGRVLQPGFQFFGFNDTVYSNTISVGQLRSKTEKDLANEIRDKLVNISTTLDDDLSVEKSLDYLDKELKKIGTTRATTSLYGRTKIKLEEFNSKRKSILKLKEEYSELLNRDIEFEKKLEDKEKELLLLKEKLNKAIILEKYKTYKEGKLLQNEIIDLQEKSKEYEKYKDLSKEDYEIARDLYNEINFLNKEEKELNTSIIEVKNRLEELESERNKNIKINENISVDYMRFESYEEEKNDKIYKDNSNQIEFIKRDYKDTLKSKKLCIGVSILSIIIFLSSMIMVTLGYPSIILRINIISIPLLIFMILGIRKLDIKLKDIKEEKDKIRIDEEKRLKKIKKLEDEQKGILRRYNIDSKLELKKLYDENHLISLKNKNREESNKENKSRKEKYSNKIEDIRLEIKEKRTILNKILERNLSSDLKELKAGLEKQIAYNNMILDMKNKQDLLEKILGDFTLDNLKKDLDNYTQDLEIINNDMDIEEIKIEIDNKRSNISNIKMKKVAIEERQRNLNKDISQLVEINEEIQRKEDLINKLDSKRASLEMAIESIKSISKDIHREFAPFINKKVGRIIKGITDNKYEGIRIDENLDMGVINPITREIISIDNLSGGTIDQLYFALRFGIIDSINDKKLPLILDDCFIQYDDYRLKNILKFLINESENRQIILFTCHNREKEILNNEDIDFNMISLS